MSQFLNFLSLLLHIYHLFLVQFHLQYVGLLYLKQPYNICKPEVECMNIFESVM
jgi:hypothetical protein